MDPVELSWGLTGARLVAHKGYKPGRTLPLGSVAEGVLCDRLFLGSCNRCCSPQKRTPRQTKEMTAPMSNLANQ